MALAALRRHRLTVGGIPAIVARADEVSGELRVRMH